MRRKARWKKDAQG